MLNSTAMRVLLSVHIQRDGPRTEQQSIQQGKREADVQELYPRRWRPELAERDLSRPLWLGSVRHGCVVIIRLMWVRIVSVD
jgi:hypothetical protein